MKASRVEDVKDTPEGDAPAISVGLNVEAPLPLCRCDTKAVQVRTRDDVFVVLYDLVEERDPASRFGIAS